MGVMGRFGDELRRERERLGVTLDAIADATKVTIRHLRAVEEENFNQLPGGVFNKGIVRSYTGFLGLDEQQWLDRFMSAYQESGLVRSDDAGWTIFAENISNARVAARPETHLRWVGVLAMVLLLVTAGWFAWTYIQHYM